MKVSEARSLDRDVVESGLTFAGFAVSKWFRLLSPAAFVLPMYSFRCISLVL